MTEPRRLLRPGQVSTLLPREARAALREAYETEPHLARGESLERRIAIETTTLAIIASYPQFFREVTVRAAQ